MAHALTGLKRLHDGIRFTWDDDLVAVLTPWDLRTQCPCAHCVSEVTGQRMLDPETVSQKLGLTDMQPVGQYAYRCLFSDQHDTGIYTIEILRQLCETSAASA